MVVSCVRGEGNHKHKFLSSGKFCMLVSCVRGGGHHKHKFLNFVRSSDINPPQKRAFVVWMDRSWEPVSELFA